MRAVSRWQTTQRTQRKIFKYIRKCTLQFFMVSLKNDAFIKYLISGYLIFVERIEENVHLLKHINQPKAFSV